MPNLTPITRKAFLATRNIRAGSFLLTEKFENKNTNQILFYLIETSNDRLGKNLQRHIHDEIIKDFSSQNQFDMVDFESRLQNINKLLIADYTTEVTKPKINSLIALISENTLNMTMTGLVEGYLLRKGKINSVTEGLSGDDSCGFFNITSGDMQLGDLVIIGNRNFFDRLSLDRIRQTLNHLTPKEAIFDFYQILKKSKKTDCNAIILQSASPSSSSHDNELSETVYLDEIIESSYKKILKKGLPVARESINSFIKISALATSVIARFGKQSLKAVQKASNRSKTNRQTTENTTRTSELKTSETFKLEKPIKIKPYKKTKITWPSIFIVLYNGLRIIFLKQNRRYLYIVLILILLFSVYIKIKSNNQNRDAVKQQNDAIVSLDKAEEAFIQANEEIGLGKSDGLDLLSQSLVFAMEAEKSSTTQNKARELIKQINGKLDNLTKTIRSYDAKPIFSFKNDIIASAVSGSTIYGFTQDGKIYATDARDGDPRLVGAIDPSLGIPKSAAYSDNMQKLFVCTDSSNIWAYDEQTQAGLAVNVENSGNWEDCNAIAAYSSYIYILDSSSGKIWRHSRSGQNFTAGKSYAGSSNTDALGGISMAIDGAIYVLNSSSAVVKFSQNITDTSFVLENPPKPLDKITEGTQLYTDSDTQSIFILDKGYNRILKFAKDGLFASQYILDGISVSQIMVNPRVQKIWAVSGKDVYELDL